MKSMFLFIFIIWFAAAELKPRKGKSRLLMLILSWSNVSLRGALNVKEGEKSMKMRLKWEKFARIPRLYIRINVFAAQFSFSFAVTEVSRS